MYICPQAASNPDFYTRYDPLPGIKVQRISQKSFFFGMCPGSQKSSIHWLYIAKILGHLLLRMCFQLDGMDLYIKKGKFQGTDF